MSKNLKDLYRDVTDSIDPEQVMTYEDLCVIVNKWLLLIDNNVLKLMFATIISHYFETDPLWMFFVAPPSGSKTEIISMVRELPDVHFLSDLTVHTLVSGMPVKKDMDPSLINKLKNNILVMKDFTTVLVMRTDDRQIILSQLREIYDGKYNKTFGTGKVVEWSGRLTLMAGVTPIIDTHSTIFQVMGERFVMYRIPQAGKKQVAKRALQSYGRETEMRKELSDALRRYFNTIVIPKVGDITLPEDIMDSLAALSSFVVTARSGVIRDQFRRDITYVPETEAPSRLAKQLGTLIKALAVLDHRDTVNWEDYMLVLRVALDIIPANRISHILALCGEEYTVKTSYIADKTAFSQSGSENIMEDLTALGIVTVYYHGSGAATEWRLSDISREFMKDMLKNPDKKLLDTMFPSESYYRPFIDEILFGKPTKHVAYEDKTQDQRLADF